MYKCASKIVRDYIKINLQSIISDKSEKMEY